MRATCGPLCRGECVIAKPKSMRRGGYRLLNCEPPAPAPEGTIIVGRARLEAAQQMVRTERKRLRRLRLLHALAVIGLVVLLVAVIALNVAYTRWLRS